MNVGDNCRQGARCGGALALTLLMFASAAADDRPVRTQVPQIAATRADERDNAQASDAQARWQERFLADPKPNWIWGPQPDNVYFLTKALPDGAKTAWIKASCDNVMTLWVNDQPVAESSDWQQPVMVDVSKHLKPAGNVLRAKVENRGGISGFLAKAIVEFADGTQQAIVTDDSWVISSGQNTRDRLPVTVHGPLGKAPWNNVFASVAENTVPNDVFETLPGFQVELLYTVPKEEHGSWVAITSDPQGRLIASDQGDKGLYRITPPPIGSSDPTRVERLNLPITSAQGLLWAFNALYISVNGGPGSGLYRARDTNNDGELDSLEKLHVFRGGGEHGPHALRLSPDGKSLYVIAGNHTRPPFEPERNADPQTMGGPRAEQLHTKLPPDSASRIPTNWDEDLLIRRQWDANGHAANVLAPGGWIAKTDPDGQTWEIVSIGYRNPYDMDFNADGELFAYDADMEWDMGSPWYRPTRVVHATSGSEFGWRSGTGKWPNYYPDSLPTMIDIGPGSPVGVEFGRGTRFPAKYQRALYILDWTFGTMYAVHLTPDGASYTAEKEEFLSRTPLPLTDATVGLDGALYFTTGGRGTQSELFRVTYVGKESTEPADLHDAQFADLRALRRQLEVYHTPTEDPQAVIAAVWPYLGHADRHIRYAARIALEHIPAAAWQSKVFAEQDTQSLLTASVGLARQAGRDAQAPLLRALSRLKFSTLSESQQQELLRAWSLIFIRLGEPDEQTAAAVIAQIDPFYPSSSRELNRELCNLLVFLKSPTVIAKTLELLAAPDEQSPQEISELLARNPRYGGSITAMLANQPDTQKVHYLYALKDLKEGWTPEQRKAYFDASVAAQSKSGGNSYRKFVQNIDREAFENATPAEQLAIEALGARKPYQPPPLPQPKGPGRDWTLDDLLALVDGKPLRGRNFKNGQQMFAATRCIVCHRFGGDGGATGPDLTQLAGRFNYKDLSESIVDPSKVVSDQYKATIVETADGKVYTGRVVAESDTSLTMSIDPEDATKLVTLKLSEIEERQLSAVSLMPKDLLKTLNQDEVLDLLAYLLSRGNPNDAVFRK